MCSMMCPVERVPWSALSVALCRGVCCSGQVPHRSAARGSPGPRGTPTWWGAAQASWQSLWWIRLSSHEGGRAPPHAMLPWRGSWDTGPGGAEEPSSGEHEEPWSSGEDTDEPGSPPQHSPQPQVLSPPGTQRKPLLLPSHAAPEQTPDSTGPVSPRMPWEVTPSSTTLPPPWDPSYQASARPLMGPHSGPGTSFSGRTLSHPSWPMYDAYGRSPHSGPRGEEHAPGDTGLPVMCYQDVFLVDPLMHCGQRVPLYLSKPPQQAAGCALKLLVPPPVMTPTERPSASQACSSTWLTEAEMTALTGLLQLSQGAPGPSSLAAPVTPATCPDPVSDLPGPSDGQSCSGGPDPCPPKSPDTHCP